MKILLVNERVELQHKLPSVGLAILATIAKQEGYHVKIIDYQLTPNAPKIIDYVCHLKPAIVGFRAVNENWSVVSSKIDLIRSIVKTIIVGGSYPSLHYEELIQDSRIDFIFRNESEFSFELFLRTYPYPILARKDWIIGNLVYEWPHPDFTTFHNYRTIEHYPLQMSRGCPHNCSFCAVKLTNSWKWRPRELKDVFQELYIAVDTLPNLERVIIIDDNPTHDMERFKKFLYAYWAHFDRYMVPPLEILNLRADKINSEIAYLLQKCGCEQFIIGVESVGKSAVRQMHKRLSQQNIINATRLLKQNNIRVGGGFIIGLPGDDWESVNNTIDFAKELELQDSCWGHLLPLKGTEVRDHVTVLNDYAITLLVPRKGRILQETASETRELPEWWIKKAWLRANAKTNTRHVLVPFRALPKIFWGYLKYAEMHTLLREGVRFLLKVQRKKAHNKNGGG